MKSVNLITCGSMAKLGDLPAGNVLVYTSKKDDDDFPWLTFQHTGTNASTVIRVYISGRNVCSVPLSAFTKTKDTPVADKLRIKLLTKLLSGQDVRVSSDHALANAIEVVAETDIAAVPG